MQPHLQRGRAMSRGWAAAESRGDCGVKTGVHQEGFQTVKRAESRVLGASIQQTLYAKPDYVGDSDRCGKKRVEKKE